MKVEPDGTEVELVPGFRVIVLTGPCPEIFQGGVEFLIAGIFSKLVNWTPCEKKLFEFIFGVEQIANTG